MSLPRVKENLASRLRGVLRFGYLCLLRLRLARWALHGNMELADVDTPSGSGRGRRWRSTRTQLFQDFDRAGLCRHACC